MKKYFLKLLTAWVAFFRFINCIMKYYNLFCIGLITLKLLLSKILSFSHILVGEPRLMISRVLSKKQKYSDISEFFLIAYFFLLCLYLIFEGLLILI